MSKTIRLAKATFLVFLLYAQTAQSESVPAFSFAHPNCKISVLPTEQTEFLYSTLEEMSKKKKFKLKRMQNKRDIFENEMYFTINVTRIKKKLYDHCLIDLKIKLASKDRYFSLKDKVIYKKESTRSLPRITLKGNERCSRALKDAFIHIPTCIQK